jgi:NAD-dependent oxidoreductase involved in siderophore biosynthesis
VRFTNGRTSVNQTALFHDTIYDAISADIMAIGGFKVVAGKLWPSESSTTAATKLRNAVNVDQPHKLCPDEVLQIKRLARENGSTATVDYEAQQLGFQANWIDPKDEGDELRRQFIEATGMLAKLASRIEKADERASLRVVR